MKYIFLRLFLMRFNENYISLHEGQICCRLNQHSLTHILMLDQLSLFCNHGMIVLLPSLASNCFSLQRRVVSMTTAMDFGIDEYNDETLQGNI